MGKLKSNKSVMKRIRVTKSGKFMRKRAGKRHLLQSKSPGRKRHLRESREVTGGFTKSLRRLLPYA